MSVPTTWLGALGLSCLSLACARTADERVGAITRLLDEARSFQAAEYAPDAMARAEELLEQARTELAAQRERPWLLSSQRRARRLLAECEAAASLARAETAAAVVRARREAAHRLAGARAALDSASEAYWRSPRGADARADLIRMRNDLDTLLGRLTEAEIAFEQGELPAAGRVAADVERQAAVLTRNIDRATASRIDDRVRRADVIPGTSDPPSRAPGAPPRPANPRSAVTARTGHPAE